MGQWIDVAPGHDIVQQHFQRFVWFQAVKALTDHALTHTGPVVGVYRDVALFLFSWFGCRFFGLGRLFILCFVQFWG